MVVGNDCISYINDLHQEILILKDVKKNGNCNIEEIDNQIKQKEELITRCKDNLSKMSSNSIEYRLYLKILDGKNPSKAVQEIADENYMNDINPSSIASIWNIYKKVKNLCNL